MSPGLRLLLVPAVALAGALACYALPPRAQHRSTAFALITTLACGGLLITLLGAVSGGAVVSRSFFDLVRGVPLGVRGDSTGVVLALSACLVVLASLASGTRRPGERTGLLLCLAGTATACVGSNLYLLVGGLELGNVGALLMTVSSNAGPQELRRAKLTFFVLHLGSLGLLASALQLSASVGTASYGAIPPEALGVGVAGPWAVAGVLRLATPVALPARSSAPCDAAWIAAAAVPTGLVTILRLDSAAGSGGIPTLVTVAMGVSGLALAGGGAALAFRDRHHPRSAGRALLAALGGQVIVALAVGSSAAMTAAAALALALMAAAVAAGAWDEAERSTPQRAFAAAALLGAGGLPVGTATTALLAASGAEVATGIPHALVAAAAGSCALVAAAAAGMAARDVLAGREVVMPASPFWRHLRVDAAIAVCASAALGLLPGSFLGDLAERVASSGGSITTIDAGAVRGPGFGWAGGYLGLGLMLTVVAFVSAAEVQGAAWRVLRPQPASPTLEVVGVSEDEVLAPAPELVRRTNAALGTVDRWLVTQPDLPALVLIAAAAVAWYSVRK
jgi:hypothetical protein